MKRLSGLLAGLVALAFAGAASASTVTITVDTSLAPDKIFTVQWDTGFGFFDSAYPKTGTIPNANTWADDKKWGTSDSPDPRTLAFSTTEATGWAGIDERGAGLFQAQFLDRMLGELRLPTASDIFYHKIDGERSTFTTNREYFWIKQGLWTAYFRNANPGQDITVLFRDKDGNAVNFSHYGVAGVPIPAAFILFGSGLVGLGWLARRQRARKDSVV